MDGFLKTKGGPACTGLRPLVHADETKRGNQQNPWYETSLEHVNNRYAGDHAIQDYNEAWGEQQTKAAC